MTAGRRDATAFAFFNKVGIIEHLSHTAFERVLPQGLSLAGFAVLNHMVRLGHEHRAPALIASAMQVTRGAMTGTLKRLQAAHWIAVTPDPADGRGKAVRITPAGRATREAAIAALSPQFQDIYRTLDIAELSAVLPTLIKVRQLLDAARD